MQISLTGGFATVCMIRSSSDFLNVEYWLHRIKLFDNEL